MPIKARKHQAPDVDFFLIRLHIGAGNGMPTCTRNLKIVIINKNGSLALGICVDYFAKDSLKRGKGSGF